MDDNQVQEKSELAIDALQYAHDHNLDINKREDVEKILESVDPEGKENIDEFIKLLKNADAAMDVIAKQNGPKKEDLAN